MVLHNQRFTPLPRGFFLTDTKRTPDPLAVIAGLPRGYGVIFRHYEAAGRCGLALKVARLCSRRGLLLVVAGDLTLARDVGARGLHLPEFLALRGRPRALPSHWLLTVAAHSTMALARAATIGADAVLAGPAFPTDSHPGGIALGPHRFARMLQAARTPVYALGGLNKRTVRKLPVKKLAGTASIGAFL